MAEEGEKTRELPKRIQDVIGRAEGVKKGLSTSKTEKAEIDEKIRQVHEDALGKSDGLGGSGWNGAIVYTPEMEQKLARYKQEHKDRKAKKPQEERRNLNKELDELLKSEKADLKAALKEKREEGQYDRDKTPIKKGRWYDDDNRTVDQRREDIKKLTEIKGEINQSIWSDAKNVGRNLKKELEKGGATVKQAVTKAFSRGNDKGPAI